MKIPLGRILIVGFAFEILFLLTLIVVVQGWLQYSHTNLQLTSALFVGVLLCGLWVGKRSSSNQVLHGSLVGLVTVLVFLLISIPAELAGMIKMNYDLFYFLDHIAKILGGALGGLIAMNLSKRRTITEAAPSN